MSLRQKLQQLSPQQRSALADALYPDVAAKMKSPAPPFTCAFLEISPSAVSASSRVTVWGRRYG